MRRSLAIAVFALLLPFAASADTTSQYQFQREGVFDCNQNGAYAMSVGALSAIGGAYVPVADAAVELNTGTLVYQQCVLREVVDRIRESVTSAFLKQATVDIQTGRNGGPQYVVSQVPELQTGTADPIVLAALQNTSLFSNANSAQQSLLQRSLAQSYESARAENVTGLACAYQGNVQAFQEGQTYNPSTGLSDFFNASSPSCNYISEFAAYKNLLDARISQGIALQMQQWNWGQGFYPKVDQNGNVVTPASVVNTSYEQILQSPFQQLQSANDIGQMIGALYAGVTTQVIGDSGGLSGISQSVGGQASYLDQVAAESATGLQGAADNAGLQILNAQQQLESAIYQAASAIVQSLTQSQTQLQTAEAQCWNSIITKVCAPGTLKSDNTCTAQSTTCATDPITGQQTCATQSNGVTLKVATSTAFSSAVISSQITPLVGTAQTNLQSAQSALQIISNLTNAISNTTSSDAQQVALQQLDSLVAQHQLHSQSDETTITQQQSSVANSMQTLLQNTANTWGGVDSNGSATIAWDGTTNPGNGWCNTSSSATLQSWINTWKQ